MMTSPRLRKKRRSSPWIPRNGSSLVALVAFLLVCGVSVCQRSRPSSSTEVTSNPSSLPSISERKALQDSTSPDVFVDLWPDDGHTDRYRRSLPNCIPSDHEEEHDEDNSSHCQVRLVENNGRLIQRVGLVHPPGRLGEVFVEYVTRVVRLRHDGEETEEAPTMHSIELVPITQHQMLAHQDGHADHLVYSKIIRMATLPILLEATDIFLLHTPATSESSPTLEDMMDLVRQLVRWQCHISHNTDTALLTITLDRMLGFSSMTTRRVQSFLGLKPYEDNKQNRIAMDDLSLIVMDVIDQGSDLAQRLLVESTTRSKGRNLSDMVNAVLDEELTAIEDLGGACRPITSDGHSGPLTNAIVEKMVA